MSKPEQYNLGLSFTFSVKFYLNACVWSCNNPIQMITTFCSHFPHDVCELWKIKHHV